MLNGDFILFRTENSKPTPGRFALVCIQITAGFFALKKAREPGVRFDEGSAGESCDVLWAAGSSSPAQILDVLGLCEGCSQVLVAFLVFSLGGGVQLQSSCISCKPNGSHRHLA